MRDYSEALEALLGYLAEGLELQHGETLHDDATLPEAPDTCVLLFENGGEPTPDFGQRLSIRLNLAVRAPTNKGARTLIMNALNALQDGFASAPKPAPGGLVLVNVTGLPVHRGRDADGRCYLEAALSMTLSDPDN